MRVALLFVLFIAFATPSHADTPADSAVDTVSHLQDGLIVLMQSSEPGSKRADAVTKLLRDTHDLPYIARVVLGRHWRDLSSEQQAAFISRFEALSVANYTARFRHYGGERFAPPDEQALAGDEHSVRSVLTTANGSTHEFVYLLHSEDGQWRIVNIVVDGVSDLALKRAEYGRLMDAGGFDALLTELDQQTEHLRAQAEAAT